MKTFKSMSDVEQVRNSPIYPIVKELVEIMTSADSPFSYNPVEDGHLVLIEPDDVNRSPEDLGLPYRLAEIPFEAVNKIGEYFHGIYIPNNQYALGVLVPDAEWLPDDLRQHLYVN